MPDPAPSGSAGPRPPGTLRLGTIAGSEVRIGASWFLVAALIAVIVAPRVEQVSPGLGSGRFAVGFAFAVILYLSVLLHEISHAVAARHYGYRVRSITLHFLGGATEIESEARRPREEFVIAVVGPLTSIAIGLAGVGLWFVTPEGVPRLLVEGLAGANLLVGVLNLVPGLPLDGGRVLKAGVWKATGDPLRGSIAAGWSGRVIAVLVLGWPIAVGAALDVQPGLLSFVLAGVVAAFLWVGATQTIVSARIRQVLPELRVRALARRALMVPGTVSVAEAVRRAQSVEAGGIVTLDRGGVPEGVVNEAALQRVPEARRPWMPVSEVARTLTAAHALDWELSGEPLLAALRAAPATEYLVLDADGAPYGVLSSRDLDDALRSAAR